MIRTETEALEIKHQSCCLAVGVVLVLFVIDRSCCFAAHAAKRGEQRCWGPGGEPTGEVAAAAL